MVWVVYCLAGFGFRLLASFELVGVGLCGVFGRIGLGLGLMGGDLVTWCVVVTCGWVVVSKTVLELDVGFDRWVVVRVACVWFSFGLTASSSAVLR